MMTKRLDMKGFSIPLLAVFVVVIAGLGFGGWYVFAKKDDAKLPAQSTQQTSKNASASTKETDPTEGGKYLVIEEWGVRAKLPENLQGKVAYVIDSDGAADPETGLKLESADIYIAVDAIGASDCAIVQTSLGSSVTITTQYIRSDASRSLDSTRYKGTFKADILNDGHYQYHLNYIMPDCIGSEDNQQKLQELQNALVHISKLNS